MKLLYSKGIESGWLGSYPGDQVMTILGRNVSGLRIEKDVHISASLNRYLDANKIGRN